MDNELLRQSKKHFSQLGLMYFSGTLLIFAVQNVAAILLQAVKPELMQNNNTALLYVMIPMYVISMPLMALLISKVPAAHIEKQKMTPGQWIIAFIMCYAILYISNIVGQIITTVIGIFKGSAVSNTILEVTTGISPWVSIFIMVLIAPAFEELLFRKLLIDRTVRYGEGVSVLLSGLMFGLFHGNLNQFAYAFTLGLFLGFIYVKTGNIKYTIFLHMLINFMGSVLGLWVLKFSGYDKLLAFGNDPVAMSAYVMEHLPQLLLLFGYFALLMGLTIAGIVLLAVKRKHFSCRAGELIIPKGKRFSVIILNLGMILFSLFWIVQIIRQLFI